MKFLLPYFAACAMAAAATLNPGDAVKPDTIGTATLIQGEVPKEWEKDKVYVLECWATWCGPCVAAIPHVNELYTELKDKGLRVVGMNVWEDDKDKVEKFVKDKGDGMSYPVVFVGKGGDFENEWLKAAEVRGIPHAFVVKNGKLLFSTHPSGLTKELVGDLLAGGEKEAAAIKAKQEAAASQGKVQTFMSEKLRPLLQAKEYDKAAEEVKTFIKENPSLDSMAKMSLTLNAGIPGFIEKGDAEGAAKLIDQIAADYPDTPIAKDADKFKEMIKKQIEAKAKKPE
ncbi:MAG: redoxin family protein [Verrucomicrobia bacterium]|nr:redoxin family protein [Verrucomicrobiota bacterium]